MKQNIQISIKNRGNANVPYDLPNECPICHHKVIIGNAQTVTYNNEKQTLQGLYICPNENCKNFFLAYYRLNDAANHFILERYIPNIIAGTEFSDIIKNISSSFVSIYYEALQAKESGLLQIAGPGFRKAFEFIIKDYAKSISPKEEHENIEKSFSGKVVSEFINDPRIQKLAERTLWLGNDETHYLRKWKNHDLTDLLSLIELTIYWINMDKLAEKYTQELQ